MAKRLRDAVVVIWIVSTVTFFLISMAPGDPCASDDPRVGMAAQAACRVRLGLDGPLMRRYATFLSHEVRLDLGESFLTQQPVRTMIADALPNTLLLMSLAIALSFVAGAVIGVLQAVRPRTIISRLSAGVTLALYSLPDYWLAQMAILVFAYLIPLFPVGGTVTVITHDYLGLWGRFGDRVYHLILPALTLTALNTAFIARLQRNTLRDVANEDYLRTARAKGLSERAVIIHHALRNALLPLIALVGLSLPALVGGAAFVEMIFAWPGMGALALQAVGARDAPVVVGCALTASVAVVIGSLVADLLSGLADPRVRERALG